MKIDSNAVRRRLDELEKELGSEELLQDRERFKKCSKEHSYLSEVFAVSSERNKLSQQIEDNKNLLKTEADPEFVSMIEEEIPLLESQLEAISQNLSDLLIPPSDDDDCATILELRAGAGGQEAALFVADCVRMYQLYAAKMGWKVEPLSATPSDLGGFKEYVMICSGKNAWRLLRHEAGTHRVQRVPDTEAQGRVHTSTITVAALQEVPEDSDEFFIPEQDLRMEATRSSGAGGQHVNTTDSAVRITHIPTGIAVFCQEERSQHKNKDRAMRLIRAKVKEIEERKRKEEVDTLRQQQVGTGDRSEKIRTYNFSQNRVTDHRLNMTRYDLDRVINGELEPFSRGLVAYFQKLQQTTTSFPWVLE